MAANRRALEIGETAGDAGRACGWEVFTRRVAMPLLSHTSLLPESSAMSSDAAPQSPRPPAPGPAPVVRKPRSSGERILVWGGIILLLALVAVQGRAVK